MFRRLFVVLASLAVLLGALGSSAPALALTCPSLDGHVVDTAGALSREQVLALDHKLEAVRQQGGFEIVAFVAGSLDGESKEDVAYTCFNTWKLGAKAADNGVLLLIAPHERTTFLATGKGVEGALTDLQSNDILNEQVIPALKENRIYDAVDRGTSAIARTLAGEAGESSDPAAGTHRRRRQPVASPPMTTTQKIGFGVAAFVFLVLMVVSPGFRSLVFQLVLLGMFSGDRRGGGGGGGGDSGSGFSGGGGSTGGGGSGQDY